MRNTLILFSALAFASSTGAFAQSPDQMDDSCMQPPNLIWVMADDLGWGDLGAYGQEVILTPELDRMANEGLRFTRFYAGATVCAPSRSVLMTGQHHGRTRVRGNAGRNNRDIQQLLPGDPCVASVLREAGYRTALIGKWGLGNVEEAEAGLPHKHGFDEFFGFLSQRHAHNHFTDFLWRNQERIRLPNTVVPVGSAGAGYSTDHACYFADWLPTAAELAGTTFDSPTDGVSMAPLLRGDNDEQAAHEFMYWEFSEGGFKQAVLYDGRWKGHRSGAADAPIQLYDVDDDLAETTDLASEHPDIVDAIEAYLETARIPNENWPARW